MEYLGLLISILLALVASAHPATVKSSYHEEYVECFEIHNQPAFRNPLLKNHVIQMRPSEIPRTIGTVQNTKWPTHEAQVSTSTACPEGMIPIRYDNQTISHHREPRTSYNPGHEYAILTTKKKIYGTKASISVWNPAVEDEAREMSISQVWISSGHYEQDDLNTIEVGWQVLPGMYKDNKTRLFLFWTSNAYKMGCYNIRCPGFIQTSTSVVIGGSISPISSFGGSQFEITIHVWKDRKSGNWWLSLGPNNLLVGYWPSEIFTTLADHAEVAEWGGEILNFQSFGRHTRTQMGSGHFSDESYGKSSYFRNLGVVDNNNSFQVIQNVTELSTNPGCYNIKYFDTEEGNIHFFYGGPGFSSGAAPSALMISSFIFIFLSFLVIV